MLNFPAEMMHPLGVPMVLDDTRVLVATDGTALADLVDLLAEFGLTAEADDRDARRDGERSTDPPINHTADRSWMRSADGQRIDDERLAALRESAGGRVRWLGPVYQLTTVQGAGGRLCPLPNVLLVRFAEGAQRAVQAVRGAVSETDIHEVKEKSELLAPYRYFELGSADAMTAYDLRDRLADDDRVADVRLEHMPMLVPTTVVPNDPNFPQQWNMTRIAAGGAGVTAWDIETGDNGVVVAVLDSGCDLGHPDLRFASPGRNLGNPALDGSPVGGAGVIGHGTCCAGIVAGRFGNGVGVAGVAGDCSILPLAFSASTDAEVAAGINAAANGGARVISMSFGHYSPSDGVGPAGWDFTLIDPAIANAVNNRNMVLCAATGNENLNTFNRYPARHPLVIAVGASDQADDRKSPTSPDGENWGSNWAPGVSVVAPGVLIPTTDIRGAGGYRAGDYFERFNGTSSATPHVAGLAALIAAQYPALTNADIRQLIERTCDKVGVTAYADAPGFPNGTRNQPMGYGRINALRALDFADVMIRDYPADVGAEPSTPPGGDFWDFSDIVVRITDDNVFDPADPARSRNVERGQTNYVYVRVTNQGARAARNVTVDARITPYVGLEFVFPGDWTASDVTHVPLTAVTASFASIPAGGSAIAKFTISAAQTQTLWGWEHQHPWHPCLLAVVRADNDYAFATASLTGTPISVRRNNLAQRNLTVIDVLSTSAATAAWPFVAGNVLNGDETLTVSIDRSKLPAAAEVLLSLDDDGSAFPLVDFTVGAGGIGRPDPCGGIEFLDRTRIRTKLGCCGGVLTLERGSRFDCGGRAQIEVASIDSGEIVIRGGRRFVRIDGAGGAATIRRAPFSLVPLSVVTTLPAGVADGVYELRASQADPAGTVVGGATVAYRVGGPR
mgnify:CR=1 FL=1